MGADSPRLLGYKNNELERGGHRKTMRIKPGMEINL